MAYEIVEERSAKYSPITYKEVAALLEDLENPERLAIKNVVQ